MKIDVSCELRWRGIEVKDPKDIEKIKNIDNMKGWEISELGAWLVDKNGLIANPDDSDFDIEYVDEDEDIPNENMQEGRKE